MAAKNDFEDRFFKLLEGVIQGIDKKVDSLENEIKTLTSAFNKYANKVNNLIKSNEDMEDRLTKLEKAVWPEQVQSVKDLPPPWRDPAIIKLATYFVVFGIIVAIIIAGLTGTEIPKGLF